MQQIAGDPVYPPAFPDRFPASIDPIVIIVRPVDKADIIFAFPHCFQQPLFPPAAVPDKAKISGNDQGISLFQPPHFFCIQPLLIAVHIAGYVYHMSAVLSAARICENIPAKFLQIGL